MAIFKCKMCGGELNLIEDSSICECEYCGTTQTVPSADNEKKMNLFGRANRLLFANEFDKASGVYESIVAEFPEEAEAYWGLILCKYGIEYVDDPATAKKVPTCHRSSFDSVMDDVNFEFVMENADSVARSVYRAEAKQIEEIRKGIIEVSNNEEPYDIFICYKETDFNGDRTVDSLIAQDTYDALTEKGYRVFFSRITLEDKLGQEYEPYIFAALNSAKVMLAFGTDYEYYNAVWVKNEWSRFLQLIAKGEKKTIIPCYKDIDAYDMPKEFARLQAQDMGKVGAIQDLVRGINKIIGDKNPVNNVSINIAGAEGSALVQRGSMALEDNDFIGAEGYFERALDANPADANAYIGKFLALHGLKSLADLENVVIALDNDKEFRRAEQFADAELAKILNEVKTFNELKIQRLRIKDIFKKISKKKEREDKENSRKEQEYLVALGIMQAGNSEERLRNAIEKFKKLGDYKDSLAKIEECNQRVNRLQEEKRAAAKNQRYEQAVAYLKNGKIEEDYYFALQGFKALGEYKDSVELCKSCEKMLNSFSDKVESGRQRASLFKDAFCCSPTAREPLQMLVDAKGNVYTTDEEDQRAIISNESNIVSASIGKFHGIGLNNRGYAVARGSEKYGQCNVATWRNLIDVKAGGWHSVGLTVDGRVVAIGNNEYGQCNVNGWENIRKIVCGKNHTVGLKSDGTVVAVGSNGNGQCDVNNWTDIKDIFAFNMQTVGLKNDGTVVAAGAEFGFSAWVDIVDVSIGYGYMLGLKTNGQVIAVGANDEGRCDVRDWKNIVAISAKNLHSAGLKSDGTVVCTGFNKYGQCNVDHWRNIVSIYTDDFCTIGVRDDGTVVLAGEPQSSKKNLYKSVKLFDDIESLPSHAEKLNAHIERVNKEKVLRAERRTQGVCQYCGGELKGLISKKCVVCSKPKDY